MRLRQTDFRRNLGWAIVLLVFPISPCRAGEKSYSASDVFVGHPAPDFKFKDAEGHDTRLSALKGRVVLLDFWTTWCGPCRAEIPTLGRLAKRFEKKGVVVLGVDAEEDSDRVGRFMAANRIEYPIVLTKDDPRVARGYAVRALPTTVVIDKDGIIAAYRTGENQETEFLLAADIGHVLSSKYVAPLPKEIPLPTPVTMPAPTVATAAAPGKSEDSKWQPKTAEEFMVRSWARFKMRQYSQAMADAEEVLKLQPDSYQAVFLHGRAAYDAKDYQTAIKDFDSFVPAQPEWADGYRYRALAYSSNGQEEKAIPDYQKVIKLRPYWPPGYNDIGSAYMGLRQFDQAKVNFDKAIEIKPDYLMARKNRAALFARENDWNDERVEIGTILNLAPNDLWAKDALDAIDHRRALPDFTPVPEFHPQLISKVEPEFSDEARHAGVNASILCSVVISKEGMPENIRIVRGAGFGLDEKAIRAVSLWRFQPASTGGQPVRATAQVELSFRIAAARNHDGQLARLNFALPEGANRPEFTHGQVPENPKGHENARLRMAFTVSTDGKPQDLSVEEATPDQWGESALKEVRNWRFRPATLNGNAVEVKGILEAQRGGSWPILGAPSNASQQQGQQAAFAGPELTWQPITAADFLARGYARLAAHRDQPAEVDAEDALKLNPGDAVAHYLHGRAAYEAKDYDTAVKDFSAAIDQKPDWPEAYRYRGLAYANSGQGERAVPDYQSALRLDPGLVVAHDNLGSVYMALGQTELARQSFDKAIELEPGFTAARVDRAKLLAKQGDLHVEQHEVVLILVLSPNDRWVKDEQDAILKRTLSSADHPKN